MVEQQLRAAADAGVPAVILSASEGGIYGRYGFGVATQVRRSTVQRRRARLAAPVDDHAVRRLTTAQARPLLPEIHERWRRQTPGGVNRDEDRWSSCCSIAPPTAAVGRACSTSSIRTATSPTACGQSGAPATHSTNA